MKTARTDLLCGSPENVAAALEALSLARDPKEYMAGTQLRSLAAELARNADLQVSVITYDNESQRGRSKARAFSRISSGHGGPERTRRQMPDHL